MDFSTALVSGGAAWLPLVAGALFLAVILQAALAAPWAWLIDDDRQNVFLGAIVLTGLAWTLSAAAQAGLSLHLLGATLLTRFFGRQLAVLALTGALLIATQFKTGNWVGLPVIGLLLIVLPTWLADRVLWALERWLPPNLFIYLLGSGFLCGGFVFSVCGVVATLLLAAIGAYPLDDLLSDYLPYWLLLSWGEAFMTGILLTLAVVYRPRWVRTFDDARYLRRPPPP